MLPACCGCLDCLGEDVCLQVSWPALGEAIIQAGVSFQGCLSVVNRGVECCVLSPRCDELPCLETAGNSRAEWVDHVKRVHYT